MTFAPSRCFSKVADYKGSYGSILTLINNLEPSNVSIEYYWNSVVRRRTLLKHVCLMWSGYIAKR